MGLFDDIEVDNALLDLAATGLFQTKTFDCMMETYRITPSGRLEIQEYEIKDLGNKEAPADSIERIAGCMAHVPTGWRDLNWHGYVEFGDVENDYLAKFTDGQLIAIERKV